MDVLIKGGLVEELIQLCSKENHSLPIEVARIIVDWMDSRNVKSVAKTGGEERDYTSSEIKKILMKSIVKSTEKGNAASQRTLAQILNLITEKQEIKHEFQISPEQYVTMGKRIIARLQERLGEHGGICPVCQSNVLSGTLRLPPEQERVEGGEVEGVALSG